MRVLHILDELSHSGAEVMLQAAYKQFERQGVEGHILSTGEEVGSYAAILQQTGYQIHHIPFTRTAGFLLDVSSLFRCGNFDAVHIHTERAFIWYVLLAKLARVSRVIRTFHNVFLFSGYLRWKRQLQRKISANVFCTVHTAIGASVLACEQERFDNNCRLINNWTDAETFRPPSESERVNARQLYELQPEDFSIVIVGSCSTVKNHLAVFAAANRVNPLLNGKRLVILHAGHGPALREEQIYVELNSIQQCCRFLGVLDDVRPCLWAADAFVMSSQWEGLPIAAIEAMSTGLPAILYDVYGLRDLIKNSKGGMLIEPKEESLVEALLFMIKHPELRKKQAQEARDFILQTYSLEDSVDRFVDIYGRRDCKQAITS